MFTGSKIEPQTRPVTKKESSAKYAHFILNYTIMYLKIDLENQKL